MLAPISIRSLAPPQTPLPKCHYAPPDTISSSSCSSDLLSADVAGPTNSGKAGSSKSKAASARSWKKPEGKPKRPLSAYNFCFRHRRAVVIAALKHSDVHAETEERQTASADADDKTIASKRKRRSRGIGLGFAHLARDVAQTWKALDADARKEFEELAKADKERYEAELAAWTDQMQQQQLARDNLKEQHDERDDVQMPSDAYDSYRDDSYFSHRDAASQDHPRDTHMMPYHHHQHFCPPPVDETSTAASDYYYSSQTRVISRTNSREEYDYYHSAAAYSRQQESSREPSDRGQQEKQNRYHSESRFDLSIPKAPATSYQRYLHDKQQIVPRAVSHPSLSLATNNQHHLCDKQKIAPRAVSHSSLSMKTLKRKAANPADTRNATFDDPALCILSNAVRVSPELSAWAQGFMGQDEHENGKKLKDISDFSFHEEDEDWTTYFLNLASTTTNKTLPSVKEEEHCTLSLSKSFSSHDLFSSKAITALYEEDSAWFTGIGDTYNQQALEWR